jgi:hypothetical protein
LQTGEAPTGAIRLQMSAVQRHLLPEIRRYATSSSGYNSSFDNRMSNFGNNLLVKDAWDNILLI